MSNSNVLWTGSNKVSKNKLGQRWNKLKCTLISSIEKKFLKGTCFCSMYKLKEETSIFTVDGFFNEISSFRRNQTLVAQRLSKVCDELLTQHNTNKQQTKQLDSVVTRYKQLSRHKRLSGGHSRLSSSGQLRHLPASFASWSKYWTLFVEDARQLSVRSTEIRE